MTEDLKYIVSELNKLLNTQYNLISFDSMSADGLLQTLVEVFKYFKAIEKFEVKSVEREECVRRLHESLKKIQYRPKIDSTADVSNFQNNLAQGDKKTIYPIFRYIFDNKEQIHQLVYLAQYLLPVTLPPEAVANPEIANLWNDYMLVMEEFKEAHKAHTQASKDTTVLKELRNDINAIDIEKENAKKRIERSQAKLDKIPQQELIMEAAHALRLERDRQKELQGQLDDQKHGLHRSKTMQERLQKDLTNARIATQGTSAQQLMETIEEETQVLEFIVKQKLPQEVSNLRQEIKLFEQIIDEPNISQEYISDLQDKVDVVTREVQQFVEKRLSERGNQNDSLLPFRQQAAIVARNKEMSAEQLNRVTKDLRDIEGILQQKQQLLQETVGEVILRGEELKQYVNTLRAKSSVYKQQRAELASVKAEVSDLTQTLENLKSQDPTLSTSLEQVGDDATDSIDGANAHSESPIETRGLTELSRVVDGLTRAVKGARERITPVSQKIRPLRDRIVELEDERESKKQAYESLNATLNGEAAILQSEIAETEATIKKLEDEWKRLKTEYDRAENLLERVREEMNSRETGRKDISVKESLQNQIREQERIFEDLQAEKEELFRNREERRRQFEMWSDVKYLLDVKMFCLKEDRAKGIGGTLSIAKNSETFTLQ